MAIRRGAVPRSTIAFVGMIIVIVGAAAFAIIALRPSQPSTTTTSSVNGIQLGASVNSTRLVPGQRLNVSLSISNTLSEPNSISAANDWVFRGVPIALWPVCDFFLPAQMVILHGNYTVQELRSVANITYGYTCAEGGSIDKVFFQPRSNQVNLTGTEYGFIFNPGPFHMSLSFVTGGYWDMVNLSLMLNKPILGDGGNAKVPPPSIPFVPGVYTIGVADEWGQATVVHVTVVPNSTVTSGGIGLISIEMLKPYTPAGPTWVLTLQNNEGCCVTNLTATLGLNNNYTFTFEAVNSHHPLGQGQFASAVLTLIGAGFNSSASYPLTIKGTTQDTSFTYTTRTRIPQSFNRLLYLDASGICTAGATRHAGGATPSFSGARTFSPGPRASTSARSRSRALCSRTRVTQSPSRFL